MSTKDATPQKTTAPRAKHTQVGDMIIVTVDDGIHNVANYEHGSDEVVDHTYSVTAERGCSCPSAKYRDGLCKHEQAVLDAKTQDEDPEEQPSITGAHVGFNAYGQADHTYWRCENCGLETTDNRLKSKGCWRCGTESIRGQQ